MSNIAVIGGTGYAGRHIVAEAAGRGHTVLSVARKVAGARVPGVTYVEGTLLDVPSLLAELQGVDAVVVAVAPRGDMEGLVRPNIEALASASSAAPAAASSPRGVRAWSTAASPRSSRPRPSR